MDYRQIFNNEEEELNLFSLLEGNMLPRTMISREKDKHIFISTRKRSISFSNYLVFEVDPETKKAISILLYFSISL